MRTTSSSGPAHLLTTLALALVLPLGLLVAGCGSGDEPETGTDESAIEVVGTWDTNFGGEEVISAETWGAAAIVRFDNSANSAITQNAADAEFSPGKFSKLVWTEVTEEAFYYCTVDYDLDTEEAAVASTKEANPSEPETSGCGDFAWTGMTKK